MTPEERYLGDGVYVSFDGFAIKLRAPREHGDHFIILEPREMLSLREFVDRCYRTEQYLHGDE